MPRIFRVLPEEGALHILTRGNNRQSVFEDDTDYKTYLNFLKTYKQQNNILLYHYCIMPNHAHLIVGLTPKSNLAKFMKQINLAYLYHYKKKYNYYGHLWQGRYKSLIISRDEYLIACGRYIELNPIKARLVKQPKEYIWSSYNAYAYGARDALVDYNPIYLDWGKSDKDRQKNYQQDLREESKRINFNARFLGSDEFIRKMEEEFQVSNIRSNRGRPKRDNNKYNK